MPSLRLTGCNPDDPPALCFGRGHFWVCRRPRFARTPSTVQRCLALRKQPKPAPAPESPDIAKLAEVVQGLTHQVQHLAMILDEVREDLVWAVRNDKFHDAGHSQRYVASQLREEAEDDEQPGPVEPAPVLPTASPQSTRTLFE